MAAPPPDARAFRATLLETRPVGRDAVVLRIALPEALGALRAGRFFMLRPIEGLAPAIPRPFSVYRQLADGTLEFLVKLVGPGTRALGAAPVGAELLAVGPLGNGLDPLDEPGPPWVLLAGGIGSAPFFMGIERALAGRSGVPPVAPDAPDAITMIYGAGTAEMLYEFERFAALGVPLLAATDDGTRGFHGNVVQLLIERWESGALPREVRLAACGPEPMMRALAREAERRELECVLSLETLMGCGVGICNGCAVPTRREGALGDWPVRKCCVDGPVFRAADICI